MVPKVLYTKNSLLRGRFVLQIILLFIETFPFIFRSFFYYVTMVCKFWSNSVSRDGSQIRNPEQVNILKEKVLI